LRVLPADEPELESPYGGTPTATAHLLQSLKICICKETTGYPASQGGSGMSHVIQSDLEDVLVSVASALPSHNMTNDEIERYYEHLSR